jgi:hypothetical protein
MISLFANSRTSYQSRCTVKVEVARRLLQACQNFFIKNPEILSEYFDDDDDDDDVVVVLCLVAAVYYNCD